MGEEKRGDARREQGNVSEERQRRMLATGAVMTYFSSNGMETRTEEETKRN